jgi:transposase
MLNTDTRAAILRLRREGHGLRTIARALGVSRNAVRRVLDSGTEQVPPMERAQSLTPQLETIQALYLDCKGNVVRVHEELDAGGVSVAYSTLTAFCRRHGIGVTPKLRAGRYHFEPGEEMQHDTSPHTVVLGDRPRKLQCASVVQCHSRMLFAHVYPTFKRFTCKAFLTDALVFFGGSASRCMVDNTSVVVARGTGKQAVFAPEMEAFGQRFGFTFAAHEVGDANRSARVERPFHYIENNFYPGRTFSDLPDLNCQLLAWCQAANRKVKRVLHAAPVELFAAERPHLVPLPLVVPPVTEVHARRVDLEGYVHLHTNRYSVPDALIGRAVSVHETKDRVRVFVGHRVQTEHERVEDGARLRRTLPEHRHPGRTHKPAAHLPPLPEETLLRAVGPTFSTFVDRLRQSHGGRAVRPIRQLHRLYLDYATEVLQEVLCRALAHGLLDLHRIERMVLRHIAGDFFRLDTDGDDHDR